MDINEKDICINFSYLDKCRECKDMFNVNCNECESENTRRKEIEKLRNKGEYYKL